MDKMLYGVQLTLIVGGLLWKSLQLARKPADRLLRIIVATLFAAVAGWIVNTVNGRSGQPSTSDNTVLLWIGHSLNPVIVCYGIACFYLVASQHNDTALRQGLQWRTALLLGAVLIVGTAVFWLSAAAPKTYIVYLVSNLYCGTVLGATAVISPRYARRAEPRLRRGLVFVGVGAGVIAVGCVLKAVVVFVTWATARVLEPLSSIVGTAMQIGILVFMVGVLYPAVTMRMAAARTWVRHLREYRQLRPLWRALNAAYPEHTLRLTDETPWDRISPTGVHRRHHRRLVEIRDGLVHISPHLGNSPPADATRLAVELRHALDRHALGEAPETEKATSIAIPEHAGRRGEAGVLIALSNAFVQREPREVK